jgi:hypothetical protein
MKDVLWELEVVCIVIMVSVQVGLGNDSIAASAIRAACGLV